MNSIRMVLVIFATLLFGGCESNNDDGSESAVVNSGNGAIGSSNLDVGVVGDVLAIALQSAGSEPSTLDSTTLSIQLITLFGEPDVVEPVLILDDDTPVSVITRSQN